MSSSADPAPPALPPAPIVMRGPSPEFGPAAFGVSPRAFAILSLVALLAARGFAPALPGSATGIATWINLSGFFAACASQLLAAGGIALCIRLLSTVSALPSVGVGFRLAMLPTGLGVVLLVAASSARPLDNDSGRVLALAAILASSAAAPLLLTLKWGREPAAILLCSALSTALELAASVLSERTSADDSRVAFMVLASAAFATSLLTSALAVRFAARDRKHSLQRAGVIAIAVSFMLVISALGASHTSNMAFVLVHRSLETLARRPISALPIGLSEASVLVALFATLSLLGRGTRRTDLRPALALCLLSGVCPGAPAAALVGVAGALLLATASANPHLLPEHQVGRAGN
jgi:hypothetical protein